VSADGELVRIDDTSLYVVERGTGYPVIVLHGGPGLDHHEFADYLDPLTDEFRLLLVDQRANGRSERPPESTWTLERMAQDVIMLARSLGLDRYAVLGHSFGAFVALQNAVDYPGMAAQTIVSGGVASMRYLRVVEANLNTFEPVELRQQVIASWAAEGTVVTPEDCARVMTDQFPFHFGDPRDPRIADYLERTKDTVYAPAMFRAFSVNGYGGIEVEDRLGEVTQPVLVTTGRHDRTCTVDASEAIAAGIANAELRIFEQSGHMTFVEEPDLYVAIVRSFLERTT
jgi:proline iminopeptidase